MHDVNIRNHFRKLVVLSISNCGSHLDVMTLFGSPRILSVFQTTRCRSSENASKKDRNFSSENVSLRTKEPRLK
jgi:hypothetical protein